VSGLDFDAGTPLSPVRGKNAYRLAVSEIVLILGPVSLGFGSSQEARPLKPIFFLCSATKRQNLPSDPPPSFMSVLSSVS